MDDEQRRRHFEKRILFAVIAGPLMLWFFRSGFHWVALQWTRSVIGTMSFCAIAILSHCIAAMAMLIVWRSPMNLQCVGKVVLAILFLVIGIPAAYEILTAVLYPSHARWPWWMRTDWQECVFWIHKVISIVFTLSCFALLRRMMGFRVVHEDARALPSQSPLSIAELLYWTAGIAVFLSLVPRLNQYIEDSGTTWPNWMIAVAFAVESLIHVTPVLIMAAAPWRLAIRIVVALIGVIAFNAGQLYLTYGYAGYPVVIEYSQLLQSAVVSIAGASCVLLWLWWHGERVMRFTRKTPASEIQARSTSSEHSSN